MASTLTRIGALGAAAALFAAGCGGGGDNKPATLTKAQVIARGTVICKAAEKRADKLQEPSVEHPFAKGTPPAVQRQARRWLVDYAAALDFSRVGLAKLAPPPEGRALFEGYVRDIGRVVADLRAASKAPGPQVEQKAMAAFGLFEKASRQTAAYGFPKGVCGAGESS